MTLTREQHGKAIRQFTRAILQLGDDSLLERAIGENSGDPDLKNADVYAHLLAIDRADLASLRVTALEDDGTPTLDANKNPVMLSIPNLQIISVLWLQSYIDHLQATGTGSIDTFQDIMNLRSDDFQKFRSTRRTIPAPQSAQSGSTKSSSSPTSVNDYRLVTFDKGIKRDPTQFYVLKDTAQFDSWNRHTIAIANAQDVPTTCGRHHRCGSV